MHDDICRGLICPFEPAVEQKVLLCLSVAVFNRLYCFVIFFLLCIFSHSCQHLSVSCLLMILFCLFLNFPSLCPRLLLTVPFLSLLSLSICCIMFLAVFYTPPLSTPIWFKLFLSIIFFFYVLSLFHALSPHCHFLLGSLALYICSLSLVLVERHIYIFSCLPPLWSSPPLCISLFVLLCFSNGQIDTHTQRCVFMPTSHTIVALHIFHA